MFDEIFTYMKVEVDQSGKIEQLNCDTVLAFSNNEQYAVLLPKSLKRRVFLYYRSRTKQLRYKLFTICLYYCLKDYLRHLTLIMIDCEYQGKEQLIKSILLGFIRRSWKEFDGKLIRFGLIGKQSNAHAVAIDVFRRHRKPNRILSEPEIETLL